MADHTPNINRSKVFDRVVNILATEYVPGTQKKLFPTIRELLCFAALLGFSEQRRSPLDRSSGVVDVLHIRKNSDTVHLVAAPTLSNRYRRR